MFVFKRRLIEGGEVVENEGRTKIKKKKAKKGERENVDDRQYIEKKAKEIPLMV